MVLCFFLFYLRLLISINYKKWKVGLDFIRLSAHVLSSQSRGRLLSAAGNVGNSGAQVLQYMGDVNVDQQTQEMLLALAQAVANATATLVLKAKNIASKCSDTGSQNGVISAARDTAMTTSQLVACVKIVVPSISSHMCQEQVVEASKLVAKAVDDTEGACKVSQQQQQQQRAWSFIKVMVFSF